MSYGKGIPPQPLEAAGLFFTGRHDGGIVRFRAAMVDNNYSELAYSVLTLDALIKFRDQLTLLIDAGMRLDIRQSLPDAASPHKEQ